MATILTKKSDTASAVPLAADLTNAAGGAELAVNATDKRLYSKTSGGTVVELGTNPSTLVLPSGSANGVAYLNGSKVVTSGSALTFDGTNLGVGGATTPSAPVDIQSNSGGTGIRIRGRASANAGSLRFFANDNTTQRARFESNDTSFEINSVANLPITFLTNDTEGMRLTSTGLGIGTSSPSQKLEVAGNAKLTGTNLSIVPSTATSAAYTLNTNTGGNFFLGIDSSTGASFTGTAYGRFLYSGGAYPIVFLTNDTERMRLDSSGNLGLGVTPSAYGSGAKALEVNASSTYWGYASGGVYITGMSNNTYGAGATNRYKNTATAGEYSITGNVHAWYTAPSGTAGNAITFTQALTLDASGNMQLGTTSQLQSSRLSVLGTGNIGDFRTSSASGYPVVCENTASGSTNMVVFLTGASTTTVGSITYNGTLTVYATTSDYRLKNVIGAVTGSGERLDALEPIEYELKDNKLRTRGFLAHKFQEVYAGSVTGTKDAVDEQGNPVYQQMQASSPEVIADLVAEIKSLRKRLADAGL